MKKKGFTLVELMIVIAVIAVLVTIIMPKMGASREKANLAACKSNLRHIQIAVEMYANDNQGCSTPNTTSSQVCYRNCSYLIPIYLKQAPTCPTGHGYQIYSNHPGHLQSPRPCVLIYNDQVQDTVLTIFHSGLGLYCPYTWVGGPILER